MVEREFLENIRKPHDYGINEIYSGCKFIAKFHNVYYKIIIYFLNKKTHEVEKSCERQIEINKSIVTWSNMYYKSFFSFLRTFLYVERKLYIIILFCFIFYYFIFILRGIDARHITIRRITDPKNPFSIDTKWYIVMLYRKKMPNHCRHHPLP